MTNGEKIQTILNIDRDCTEVHGENGTMTFTVTQDFWNAEYKESTKSKYEDGALYFDCKDGVYGINTSSDRKGRFFPLPTDSFTGRIDYEYFKKHYNNVYEYVGEILEAESEEEK